jgi:DNA gyrase/topoisomerase IV subunit B
LHKGLKVTFENETAEGGPARESFQHDEGIGDYLRKILVERKANPVHEQPFGLTREHDESGLKLDLVMRWTESTDEHVRSYVNGIPTGSGGTHENGLRGGIGKAIRNFIETHNLSPKGVTLTAEDIREGLTGVVSVFVEEPRVEESRRARQRRRKRHARVRRLAAQSAAVRPEELRRPHATAAAAEPARQQRQRRNSQQHNGERRSRHERCTQPVRRREVWRILQGGTIASPYPEGPVDSFGCHLQWRDARRVHRRRAIRHVASLVDAPSAERFD